MGWKELEELNAQTATVDNRFNELCCQIFLQSPGKEFLHLLKEQFLCAPVANPTDSAAVAYFREGQNSLIRRIISGISPINDQLTNTKIEVNNDRS